jgi:hypothetical protein
MKREQADALLILADPLLFAERPQIVQLAARHRLPAIYDMRLFPESGGLLSYGPLAQERFERMAVYVDRILRSTSRPPRRSPSRSRHRSCFGRIRRSSSRRCREVVRLATSWATNYTPLQNWG